ncbi:MAG TPA: hypothetical protein VGE40_08250 [Bacilli bacterium]
MIKAKSIKITILLLASVMMIFISSYSFIFAKHSERNIIFYSNDHLDTTQVFNTDEKAMEKAKKYKEDGNLKFQSSILDVTNSSFMDFDSVAYPYETVRNDKKLQLELQQALSAGKKVYLYGDLSLTDYTNALDTEIQMEIPSKDNKSYIIDLTDNNDEKADKKKRPQIKSLRDFQIIGLSKNTGDELRLLLMNIDVTVENGSKVKPSSMIYLQSILQHEAKGIERVESKLLSINSAAAGNTIVKSSSAEIISSAIYLSGTAGQIISQWLLSKNNDEIDSTYDYFSLEDQVQYTQVDSGWDCEVAKAKHTLPYTSDEVWDSDPDDTNDGPFSISIGTPWFISFNYTINTAPDINLTEDLVADISTWDITDNAMESEDKHKFTTAWKSTGTLAAIDVYHYGKWHSGINVYTDTSQSFQISYDY